MRYALITSLILAGGLAGGADAFAQSDQAPAGVRGLRAHQVVEQVLGLRAELALSDRQTTELTALHTRLLREKSGYRTTGPKARHAARRPVTSASEAYSRVAAGLDPAQRATAFGMLDRPRPHPAAAAMADPLTHQQ